jgi:hypothetical protein
MVKPGRTLDELRRINRKLDSERGWGREWRALRDSVEVNQMAMRKIIESIKAERFRLQSLIEKGFVEEEKGVLRLGARFPGNLLLLPKDPLMIRRVKKRLSKKELKELRERLKRIEEEERKWLEKYKRIFEEDF